MKVNGKIIAKMAWEKKSTQVNYIYNLFFLSIDGTIYDGFFVDGIK